MKLKVLRALLRPNPPDISMEALEFATSTAQGPDKLASILSGEAKKSYWPGIGMNGERCRDANLPFEPSMRRADGILAIAMIQCATVNCTIANFGRAKNGGEVDKKVENATDYQKSRGST